MGQIEITGDGKFERVKYESPLKECGFDTRPVAARITFPDSQLIINLCEEHRDKMLDALGVKVAVVDQLESEARQRRR